MNLEKLLALAFETARFSDSQAFIDTRKYENLPDNRPSQKPQQKGNDQIKKKAVRRKKYSLELDLKPGHLSIQSR
jgi:hypothetical protein